MKYYCTKVIVASLLGITSTSAVGVGSTVSVWKAENVHPHTEFYLTKSSLVTLSQVDGRRDDGRKDDRNEAQRKLRGNVYKALVVSYKLDRVILYIYLSVEKCPDYVSFRLSCVYLHNKVATGCGVPALTLVSRGDRRLQKKTKVPSSTVCREEVKSVTTYTA